MGITFNGSRIPSSFASCSINSKSGQSLHDKMKAISKAGFDGMEIAMPDILAFANLNNDNDVTNKNIDTVLKTAAHIKSLAKDLGIEILMLQPFARFEGWKGAQREEAMERAALWLRVMDALGTKILQVGSSDAEDTTSSVDDLAEDLRQLATMCANKGFYVAYENWCWATHAPTWKTVWEIVKRADHPNLGLCLDTFQSAGGEFGDPTTSSGFIETLSKEGLEKQWLSSLDELSRTVPADKIYLLQISDAYKMDTPIQGNDKDGQRPRAQWSHSHRPLPGHGGYLPIQGFLDAVLNTGFRGWLSVEVFDPEEEKKVTNEDFTKSAMESLRKLMPPE